jgi:4-amino-4-deoxy-L-arabinose transferase-like glycosyltransferase
MLRLPAGASMSQRCAFALGAGVLLLALFNVTFRLHRQPVQEWDESLYATSAWEMLQSGQWVAHTFRGELDYYNTKPPLNIWLIVLSFKAFGVGLIPLRVASVLATLATVAVLMWWARRRFGEPTALFGGLVLASMFAFFYVHSGRTANTDAINTLLIVLTAVTVSEARDGRWRLLSLGPVFAAVFLLRGMAVIMPAAIALVGTAWSRQLRRDRLAPAAGALILFTIPVGAWMLARYRIDEWRFLEHLFWYDFVARTTTNIEDHPGSVFYYLNILQKHHYDWLIAALAAWLLFPVPRERLRAMGGALRTGAGPIPVLAAWGAVAFAIPTLMSTKIAWYLHPFYPVFAIAVGAILAHAAAAAIGSGAARWRRIALVAVVGLAVGIAEGRMVWYSYNHRNLHRDPQGLLLDERDALKGRQVFGARWDRADIFVAEAVVGARHRLAPDLADFLRDSRPGDYYRTSAPLEHEAVTLVRSNRRAHLYKRIE